METKPEVKRATMEKIVALCKNRGFIFPGSEIYGGLANTWDYGPLGVRVQKQRHATPGGRKFVQESPYNVGLNAAILMNPQTWVASGHVGGFSDPLLDCQRVQSPLPRRQAHRGFPEIQRHEVARRGRPEATPSSSK